MIRLHEGKGPRYFTFPGLDQIPSFVHAVTHRDVEGTRPLPGPDGPWTPSQRELLDGLEIRTEELFFLRQVHSDTTVVASGPRPTGRTHPEADGVIWYREGFFPVVRTADCVSVLVVSPTSRTAGLFHAGWRGTCHRIVEKGLGLLLGRTRLPAGELVAAIGPAMRGCCYQVGEEVKAAFADQGHDTDALWTGDHLDLIAANRAQLEAAGVEQIHDSGLCTGCNGDAFYSWRREETDQRIWTLAGFR